MATTTTGAVNEAFYFILVFTALLFAAIVFFMVLFLVRYRASAHPRPVELRGNPWFEVAAFVLPTLLALAFFWYGLTGYQFLRRVPQGALQVQVHAKQFAFTFEYPGGRKDPALVVPVGSDVRCNVTSDDVLHGFYIPALHIQIDAVPGLPTYAWFHAREVGSYDILCTVYCGTAHSAMMAKLRILPVADYERWKRGEEVDFGERDLPPRSGDATSLLDSMGCLACHSLDGSIGLGPSFKGLYGSEVKLKNRLGAVTSVKVDEAFLARSVTAPHEEIAAGFEDLMPDYRDRLKGDELKELVMAIKAAK